MIRKRLFFLALLTAALLITGCNRSTKAFQGPIDAVMDNGFKVGCSEVMNKGKKNINSIGYDCTVTYTSDTIFTDASGNTLTPDDYLPGSEVRVILTKPARFKPDMSSTLTAEEIILIQQIESVELHDADLAEFMEQDDEESLEPMESENVEFIETAVDVDPIDLMEPEPVEPVNIDPIELVEPDDMELVEPTEKQEAEAREPTDYSLFIGDHYITLSDWDDEIDLEVILGPPLTEHLEEIKQAAQLTGSYLKTLEYDGLRMELFSPAQNGKTFWIMSMEVSKEGYKTARGIEVGSTLEEMKAAYPEIEEVTWADPYFYQLHEGYNLKYLRIEVHEDLVSKIRLFRELN